MQTPDGEWRVEPYQRGRGTWWYRLSHHDNVVEDLSLATVERLLAEAGVDLGDLVDADEVRPANRRDGAA